VIIVCAIDNSNRHKSEKLMNLDGCLVSGSMIVIAFQSIFYLKKYINNSLFIKVCQILKLICYLYRGKKGRKKNFVDKPRKFINKARFYK
jgi:energy-converting hydrogenase Eha subunit C